VKKLISKQNGHKIFINDNYANRIQRKDIEKDIFNILESLRLSLNGYSSYNYNKNNGR